MKVINAFCLIVLVVACSPDTDSGGVIYSGRANLNVRMHEFTATNEESRKNLVLTMTGPHELTFNLNDRVSHIDYEKDIIIIQSETDSVVWSAHRVKGGFELEDGTVLKYGNCRGWSICLEEEDTDTPILKGKYSLSGNSVEITLWISDHEKHVELLGLMANGLFNKSKNTKQSIESALESVSTQVWTY